MLTKLDFVQIEYIYKTYMVNDFPPDELKPLANILRMVENGLCTCYALYEGGKVLSYFNLCEKDGYVLVDYLAVNPEMRGQGIGSKTLNYLIETVKGKCILIECENVLKALTAEERIIRQRRIAFYERAGFALTDVRARLFGVDYVLLTYPQNIGEPAKGYDALYREMLGEELYSKNLTIYNVI